MNEASLQLLIDAAIAIGIGLFIGLEREHREAADPVEGQETMMGVRTFALLSLIGALAGNWSPWLPVASLVVVGALIGIATLAPGAIAKGLTTQMAAVATFLLGMLVHQQRLLAIALGLATMLLLISKPWFTTVVPKMKRMDLTSTLQLAVLLAIVLPLLPTEARDPWSVLSPRRLGIFVALIAGISYVGYLVNRLVGHRRGAGLTGLIGGLASSTAVTAAMAQQAKGSPAMIAPGQLATMLASTVMFARVLVVSALIDHRVAVAMAVPMAAMALATVGGAYWRWRALAGAKPDSASLELENPFSLLPALKWGALLALILVISAVARQWLGDAGLLVTAAVSGLMDVDAINLAASRHAAAEEVAVPTAALAIMMAVGSNTLVKAGIAFFGGGRSYGLPIVAVFGGATGVGLAAALIVPKLIGG